MSRFGLNIDGYAAASFWGYDELTDTLRATIAPDDGARPIWEIDAVTIDQLMDAIDTATGSARASAGWS